MKKFVAPMLAIAMSASSAFAGGPVVIEEEPKPMVEAAKPRSGWIVPVVVGLILVCAVACGNNDDNQTGD